MRTDPIWEFGSFGCTGCHSRLLRDLQKANQSDDNRLAFVQGGNLGTRIVHLTSKVQIIDHGSFLEAKWELPKMPFAYKSAPILIDNAGYSDCPAIIELFEGVNKTSPISKFASKFRSRGKPLPQPIGRQVIETYCDFRQRGVEVARHYKEALPFPPPKIDQDRESTYNYLVSRSHLN
ncbi:MAG: hypothetical protein F4234_04210 [Gammaproteobacteria bacterium]|nr:hypothetical protein [Gammaproteobacteria bacterium]